MKKKELRNTLERVRMILERYPETRNSDDLLYYRICKSVANDADVSIETMPLAFFLLHRKAIGFPPFESVRRARQKVQAKFPHLDADPSIEDARDENEMVYREFSRE